MMAPPFFHFTETVKYEREGNNTIAWGWTESIGNSVLHGYAPPRGGYLIDDTLMIMTPGSHTEGITTS